MNVKDTVGTLVRLLPRPICEGEVIPHEHNLWLVVDEVQEGEFLFQNRSTRHERKLKADNIQEFRTPNLLILRGQVLLKEKDKKFFRDLLWPGAAGSIFWAFFTVLIDPNFKGSDRYARAFVLGFLAIYLSFDWLTSDWNEELTPRGFGFNLIYILLVTGFAAATATELEIIKLWCGLLLLFSWAFLGLMSGAWDTKVNQQESFWTRKGPRFWQGGGWLDALACIALFLWGWFAPEYRAVALPTVFGLLVLFWIQPWKGWAGWQTNTSK